MVELALIWGAFFAGFMMFFAPCTLPLVPGYLVFIAGVPPDMAGGLMRSRVFKNALAFVIGFSVIFILLGVFAGFIGATLGVWRFVLARAAGVILILFGLTMLGVLRIPLLSGERRARVPSFLVLGRWESSLLIGMLFALGWSPCIGPILGTILLFASQSATALQGGLLLAIFSLGLALPFLLTALFIAKAQELFVRLGRATVFFEKFGALVLLGVGLLMVFGQMDLLIVWGYGLFDFIGYDRLLQYL